MRTNVVIIGAGVVGSSVAYHLTARGETDVLLLEREAQQGMGSTGKATGGVRAQFETDINIRLSMYSIDFFRNWDIDVGYEPRGYLFFATSERQLDQLKKNVSNQKWLGLKDVEIVDRETIHSIVPGINSADIVGGSFCTSDGFIDPLAVMRGFTRKASDRGARVKCDSTVLSLVIEHRRVRAVNTQRGPIECKNVVLCSGAWSRSLAATAGIDLPVDPLRRQIVWSRTRGEMPAHLPMVIDFGTGFHFRPAPDRSHPETEMSEILFAYPDPNEPVSFNTEFDDTFIDKVYGQAKHRAGFLYESDVIREKCRAGLYENTPDHHAILGGCEIEGLYFACGFSGHGVMHSPAAGRALSEIILDGRAAFLDVSPLSCERFAEGKLLVEETGFI